MCGSQVTFKRLCVCHPHTNFAYSCCRWSKMWTSVFSMCSRVTSWLRVTAAVIHSRGWSVGRSSRSRCFRNIALCTVRPASTSARCHRQHIRPSVCHSTVVESWYTAELKNSRYHSTTGSGTGLLVVAIITIIIIIIFLVCRHNNNLRLETNTIKDWRLSNITQ